MENEVLIGVVSEASVVNAYVETLHEEILTSRRALYSDSDVLEPLMERLGLHRAITDIPKTWKKVE